MNTTTKSAQIIEKEPGFYHLVITDNRVKETVDAGHYATDLWVEANDLGIQDENISITTLQVYDMVEL
jgi:hypothetical protein